jgi:hypothetical protein
MNIGQRWIAPAVTVSAIGALLLLSSPAMSQGKKKSAAPAEPKTHVCFLVQHPVCATKGSARVTYNNSCYARADGAKVVAQGACPAPKMKKGKK